MSQHSITQLDDSAHNRPIQVHILANIPKQYQDEPIISHLASRYGLKVNILAATLGADTSANGWFDLQLRGLAESIDEALLYLVDQNIGVFRKDEQGVDGW